MPRPRLRRPEQPLWLQLILAGVEFLASLRLAVIVIVSLIVVLAGATFIETTFGAPAARFAVYRSWWFALLGALLGMNVFCAAAVRFPWKRYQTGFVVTHAGIIILLWGSLLTARHGIDAQLSVYEGTTSHLAFEDDLRFEIERVSLDAGDERAAAKILAIPFRAGPFNWRDYSQSWQQLLWAPPGRLPVVPWALAHRDRGLIYQDAQMSLEVLDYYADSKRVTGGYVAGYASVPAAVGEGLGWLRPWQPFELALQTGRVGGSESIILGSRTTLPDGTRLVVVAAVEEFERDGFLLGYPEGDVSGEGQVVLVHNRTRYVITAFDRVSASTSIPLGQTGLRVVGVEHDRRFQSVQIRLENADGETDDLILFADLPEFNRSSKKFRVSGAYWVDFPALLNEPQIAFQLRPETTQGADRPRIELCQGPSNEMYYRAWLSPRYLGAGRIPLDGQVKEIPTGRGYSAKLVLSTFLPITRGQETQEAVVPLPFRKGARMTEPRVRIRVKTPRETREMWLAVLPRGATTPLNPDEVCRVSTGSEEIRVTVKHNAIDVGFWVKLLEFQRRMDPGTNQPSHYASLVDLYVPEEIIRKTGRTVEGPVEIDPDTGVALRRVHSRVLITLNHPINVTDPVTGRSYRLYQESFSGPFRPGDPIYERVVGGRDERQELYVSTLSVNYDPGRGFKYMGSLLIVGGIVIMYLMRAYMFRPRARSVKETTGEPTVADRDSVPGVVATVG